MSVSSETKYNDGLSGWWRIWIVLSIPLALSGWYIGFQADTYWSEEFAMNVTASEALSNPFAPPDASSERKKCLFDPEVTVYPTYPDTKSTLTTADFTCKSKEAIIRGVKFAVVPPLILWNIWFAIAYIARGFRPRRS